ncbi:YerC/YecD family TrpR-related protein [uncultured Clostridium sp.]|uniref:YerC/YecD family TrpR-related protein n=1 Tax=uncultured Clostridium sp. TaxID=59620 RepID=UPI0028ED732E|nr:YerC/YecD family TrpR-related protein [uncultured Clostridium sp.]
MSAYKSKIEDKEIDFLYDAILKLQTREECYKFFDDICTINEIQSLSQRMQVAKMLKDKRTYQDISITTGASTATISRVNRCLNYGSEGYEVVLSRLEEDNKENK